MDTSQGSNLGYAASAACACIPTSGLHPSPARACSEEGMDESISFGAWLKQRRKALDLTQDELARRIGSATVTLQKIELDERRPSKGIAARLAEVLDIPPAERPAFLRVA